MQPSLILASIETSAIILDLILPSESIYQRTTRHRHRYRLLAMHSFHVEGVKLAGLALLVIHLALASVHTTLLASRVHAFIFFISEGIRCMAKPLIRLIIELEHALQLHLLVIWRVLDPRTGLPRIVSVSWVILDCPTVLVDGYLYFFFLFRGIACLFLRHFNLIFNIFLTYNEFYQ